MKKIKLFVAALGLLGAMTASAQTDVTATYIKDADFSSIQNWTQNHSSSFWALGNGKIGTYAVENNKTSTTDETHLDTEWCLGIQCRWSSSFANFSQVTAELPAGVYTLSYDVQNTNASNNVTYNNLFSVTVGETIYADTKKEWMSGQSGWTTHSISFTVTEAATATISFGYGTGNNNIGSGSTPHLYVSHLNLTWTSLLEGVKALWEEAHQAAVDAKADEAYENVTGEELAALEAEIEKAEPTTQEGYEQATADLNAAVATFKGAKDAYDGLAALWNNGVPELIYATTAKYTAIGDAYFGEGDVVNAEDALARTAAMQIAIRAYYESHALAENVEGAVDVTSKLFNPTNPANVNGWTENNTYGHSNIRIMTNEPYTNADGTTATGYFDSNSWGNAFTVDFTQNVELAAGRYLLTAKARGNNATEYQVVANGETADVPVIGNQGGVFGRGWNDTSVEFELNEKATVALGVHIATGSSGNWVSFGDFRLVRLELYTEMADAADYQALNDAIAAAEANVLGFEENEFAPYNNVEAIQALAAAKALDQTAENAKDEVEALTAALEDWTANAGEVNAIYDGQFANTEANTTSGDINLPGWTKVQGIRLLVKDAEENPGLAYTDGGAAVFSWGGTTLTYGEQVGYTLPLKAEKQYKLSLKVSGWKDGDLPAYVQVGLDGVSQSKDITVGRINATEGNPFASVAFVVEPKNENSVLTISTNHHFTIADLELVEFVPEEVVLKETDAAEFIPSELPVNVTVNRTIKANEWAAVAYPFAVKVEELGEYVEVAEFTGGTANTLAFETVDVETLEAGHPYLVRVFGENDVESVSAEKVVLSNELTVVDKEFFSFVPTFHKQYLNIGDAYIAHGDLIKTVEVGTVASINGFRGFLQPQTEVTAKSLTLMIDGVVTGIVTIENGQLTIDNGAVYNLNGQRVNATQRGIYIVNGKKVVIK